MRSWTGAAGPRPEPALQNPPPSPPLTHHRAATDGRRRVGPGPGPRVQARARSDTGDLPWLDHGPRAVAGRGAGRLIPAVGGGWLPPRRRRAARLLVGRQRDGAHAKGLPCLESLPVLEPRAGWARSLAGPAGRVTRRGTRMMMVVVAITPAAAAAAVPA